MTISGTSQTQPDTSADVLRAARDRRRAGVGAPTVAEYSVAEFASAVGLSTEAGSRYLGEALVLCSRLPRHWARITSGELPAWKARRVARETVRLSPEAAAHVDTHVLPRGRGGPTRSCNIAALCRRHHRLKTHSPWSYLVLDPGSYLWTSPHGNQFRRDDSGTLDVSPDRPRAPDS